MAIRDTYTKQPWENLPSENTPVSAERLEHIEQGIKDSMDNRALKEIYDDIYMIFGTGNTISGGHFITLGNENTINGGRLIIAGTGNKTNGVNYCIISGSGNEVAGANHIICGENNESTSGNNIVGGRNNSVSNRDNIVSGSENTVNHSDCLVSGSGNKTSGDKQVVFGRYNDNASDIYSNFAFIIGGGTSDTDRKNIFTVNWSGSAKFAGEVENGAGISLGSLKTEIRNLELIIAGGSIAKVFSTKTELDEWLAVEGNTDTLKVGQNIYIIESNTPDYWWDGTGLQALETEKVVIESMTYGETMQALNSEETGEMNKIPNLYAIRDWCKTMINPSEGA